MASTFQQTTIQINQANSIAVQPFVDEDVASTLIGLGLRVQNLTLTLGVPNAPQQQSSIPIDEYGMLSQNHSQPLQHFPIQNLSLPI